MVKGSGELDMREERYLQIVAAYGADPKCWPAAERAAALAFAAAQTAAGAAPDLREEQALDAALKAYASSQPAGNDDAAMARIIAAMQPASGASNVVQFTPRRAPAKTGTSWLAGRGMMAAGFAAAAILGVVIGVSGNGVSAPGEISNGVNTADASGEVMVSYALAEG